MDVTRRFRWLGATYETAKRIDAPFTTMIGTLATADIHADELEQEGTPSTLAQWIIEAER